jgi:hypothetical protein
MGKTYFLEDKGIYVFNGHGEPKRVGESVQIGQLPDGDWFMRACNGTIVMTDRTGKNPAYIIREGKMEVLQPTVEAGDA